MLIRMAGLLSQMKHLDVGVVSVCYVSSLLALGVYFVLGVKPEMDIKKTAHSRHRFGTCYS